MKVQVEQQRIKLGYLYIKIGIGFLLAFFPAILIFFAFYNDYWLSSLFLLAIGWFVLQMGRNFTEVECPQCKVYNKWNAKKCKSCTIDLEIEMD